MFLSFKLATNSREKEVSELLTTLEKQGMKGYDISDDELAKSHGRYMIGGAGNVENERLFRFGTCSRSQKIFPPRWGRAARRRAEAHSLQTQNSPNDQGRSGSSSWACKRNGTSRCSIIGIMGPVGKILYPVDPRSADPTHRPDIGKVLAGIQVPPEDNGEFDDMLKQLGYTFVEETENAVYRRHLRS